MRKVRNTLNTILPYLRNLILISFIIILVVFIIIFKPDISTSRYSILLYHEQGSIVTLIDAKLKRVHVISIPQDAYVTVPGGYGEYKQSALKRFATLEQKPYLVQNTFAYTYKNPITFTLYPKKQPKKITLGDVLFSSMSLLEKLHITYIILSSVTYSYAETPVQIREDGAAAIDTVKLSLLYSSLFLDGAVRSENIPIILNYNTSMHAARTVEGILVGGGMNILDIVKKPHEQCLIRTSHESITSTTIRNFLRCPVQKNDAQKGMIIIDLGEKEILWDKK